MLSIRNTLFTNIEVFYKNTVKYSFKFNLKHIVKHENI